MPSFYLLLLLVILWGSLKAAVCAVAHALSALRTAVWARAGLQGCSLLGCVLGKTLSSCVCGQGSLWSGQALLAVGCSNHSYICSLQYLFNVFLS